MIFFTKNTNLKNVFFLKQNKRIFFRGGGGGGGGGRRGLEYVNFCY